MKKPSKNNGTSSNTCTQDLIPVNEKLCNWFVKNHANFPWRLKDLKALRDPYAVWISETMLQQTQVSTVQDAFKKWMTDFPNVLVLSKASEQEVLLHWQGLGYYTRARNILKAARDIAKKYSGKFPENRGNLESLPGVGAYTAGAILSLAFHQQEPILDGNLVRIFSRLYLWNFLPNGKGNKEKYWGEAEKWCRVENAFLTNEALMELGRSVCKKSSPLCRECPLASICRANRESKIELYPPKKQISYTSWEGFALVLLDPEGNCFVHSTADTPFLKNQLSFPLFEYSRIHGDAFPGIAETLIHYENVKDFEWKGVVEHSITRYKIKCRVLCVHIKERILKPGSWISPKDIRKTLASSFALKIAEVGI